MCASGFRSSLISTPAKKKKPAFKKNFFTVAKVVVVQDPLRWIRVKRKSYVPWVKREKVTVVCFSGSDVGWALFEPRRYKLNAAWLSKGEFGSCLVVWALPWLQGEGVGELQGL